MDLVGSFNTEKYEFVNWDDDIPLIYGKIKNVPNHKPVIFLWNWSNRVPKTMDQSSKLHLIQGCCFEFGITHFQSQNLINLQHLKDLKASFERSSLNSSQSTPQFPAFFGPTSLVGSPMEPPGWFIGIPLVDSIGLLKSPMYKGQYNHRTNHLPTIIYQCIHSYPNIFMVKIPLKLLYWVV